ncbi:tRNA 2-selenouridine(34) synthase MnmH [Acidaminobacter sp.]|uniref:tRNA 2-selenouridine(34) synthase MnmH n=1 Tax=Acidaminobacter sp. TaxID=1872102 RepID=UPI00137DE821|nr:tRNA 2-selenouridine(34) synthase MnmH [Acidaminobacter sp.]MDK9711763.1 tRNA 2-selenouridine(34) synthase MnmH [Acidaminobacter sp.]MZQ96460.1 tRNA 2-selenouridine(34) synthase MnmH [Acidaminobacter sp.]
MREMWIPYDQIEGRDHALDQWQLIDVRSPGEYREGTIGEAINLPIFGDELRAEVGTAYKKQSVLEAKRRAIKAVAAQLPELYEHFLSIEATGRPIAMFCARGGMRSQSFASLLRAIGHNVCVIEGGYKAYRQYMLQALQELSEARRFIVLHGNTGVGKTLILNRLEEQGLDVIDIEALAHHRGSMLGRVGLEPQPTQKTFEDRLYRALKGSKSGDVFVEAESKRLGRVNIDDAVLAGMRSGRHIFVDAPMWFREREIVSEYTRHESSKAELLTVMDNFRKHLGNETVDQFEALIQANDYGPVARALMERYYDPKYEYTSVQYDYDLKVWVESVEDAAQEIHRWYEHQAVTDR